MSGQIMRKNIFPLAILLPLFLCFYGCGGRHKSITRLADLQEVAIGAMTGTTGERLAQQRFPKATVKSFDDIMDAIAALKSDQLDAVITGWPAALNVCKHNADLQLLSEPVEYEYSAVAVAKGNDRLLAQVNRIVAGFQQDGTLKDMRRRWIKNDLSPYERVEIPPAAVGRVLVVGTSATREPFCYVDENRNIAGHDGELARRIAARMGRPIQFSDMKFSALIPALQSGKIDLIIAGMTATDERRKSVNFSDPYFKSMQVIIAKKPAAENAAQAVNGRMRTVQDLHDKRIGVLAGSVHDGYVEKNYPEAGLLRYNSWADMILALQTEKLDAVFVDLCAAKVLLKSNPDIGVLTENAIELPVGYGFSKKNPALRERFNKFLKTIKSDGTFKTIYQRWYIDDPEKAQMPRIELDPKAPLLNLGVAVGDLPNSAIINNEHVGMDIEILKTFAQREGFNLRIITMEFSALVAAIASEKVDIIADGIFITEERQKRVDFCDPYNYTATAVLALKKNLAAGEPAAVEKKPPSRLSSFFKGIAESFHSNIILEKRYLLIIDGLKVTMIISILSVLFGTVLGGLICFMRMSHRRLLSLLAKLYISVLRGTPVLVILMIIFYVVFASVDINPVLVAVIAFGLNFGAYVSEMFRTGIESIDRGQTEAGIALGFTKVQTFVHIVAPQAIRRILPVYKGELISLVKMTSIVGYIAVQDLTKASDIIRSRTFDAFFPLIMVAVLYFFISWLLLLVLGYLERSSDPKLKPKRREA